MKRLGGSALIILIGLFFGWGLLQPGFMQTHDTIWHVERILNMTEELRSGQFPVRWSYSLDNGFGIPLFNFAYPGPYYLMSLAHLAGLGVIAVYNLTNLAFFLLGGLGMYWLYRKKSEVGALTTAVLYMLAPYQLLDIYVRGALGEVVVLGLFPWCLYMIDILGKKKKLIWYTPLPLFLVLISHNFLGLIFIGLLLILSLTGRAQKKLILQHIAVAVALAAFFLLPMIGERNLLMESPPGNQNATLDRHYVYPAQLVWSPWGYTGSLPGNDPSEISYQLGLAHIAVILYALITARKKAGIYLVLVAGAVFMMTPYSSFIWRLFPILQVIQFPWRLLAVTSILVPLIFMRVYRDLEEKNKKRAYVLAGGIVIIAFLNVMGYRQPERRLSAEEFGSLHAVYEEKTATAYRYELMPRWAVNERSKPAAPTVAEGAIVLSGMSSTAYMDTFTAESQSDGAVIVYRNYYPSWKGTADGETIPLAPSESGEIRVPVRPGTHTYRVKLGNTPLALVGNWVTLLTLAGTIVLWRKNG